MFPPLFFIPAAFQNAVFSNNIYREISDTKKGGITIQDITTANIKNEIRGVIVREGLTMGAVVRRLAERYEWSGSIANFSEKLRRGSLRYREALELADTLGYDLVWRKRGEAQNG